MLNHADDSISLNAGAGQSAKTRGINVDEGPDEQLHVLDLPPLYSRPAAQVILAILDKLAVTPSSFDQSKLRDHIPSRSINETGVPRYLTSIISSSLSWIEDDNIREEIWENASRRLAERAGRSAAPSLTRTFTLPATATTTEKIISLHEPSMTADNLGHKTWSSSFSLALLLPSLAPLLPKAHGTTRRVLELGSGTGLFGIAFAALFPGSQVTLTDLPEIVANLTRNVVANEHLLSENGGEITAGELDWTTCPELPTAATGSSPRTAVYEIVLAADPIYSPHHPGWLTRAVYASLSRKAEARFILGLPIREAYLPQLEELWFLMHSIGLEALLEGEEECVDDWIDQYGEQVKVRVKWAVWAWKKE